MFQKDYIMRMIEDFVRVMAKIIFNREMKNFVDAKDQLDGLCKLITGFGLEHLKQLGTEGILYVFGTNKDGEIEKIYCSARMLKEDGMIYEAEGKTEESLKSFTISMELFEFLSQKDFVEKEESMEEAKSLKEKINNIN